MFIPFLSRLTGFSLPHVEATTSIQDTFVRQMSELASAQGFWRYSPHWLFKKHGGLLKQVAGWSLAALVASLGVFGAHVLFGVDIALLHVAAYTFAVSAITGQVLLTAFLWSLRQLPSRMNERTAQRFLELGAELALKDKAVAPLLKAFGGQLKKGRPQEWWESVLLAMKTYNSAIERRADMHNKAVEQTARQEAFDTAVETESVGIERVESTVVVEARQLADKPLQL